VPFIARDLVVSAFLQRGVEAASLKRVSVDWWNARVEIEDLQLLDDQQQALSVERLSVDIYLAELLNRRVQFSDIKLEGADIRLRQEQQALLLGPIILISGATEPHSGTPRQTNFLFGSDQIELMDVSIVLGQGQASQRLDIESLSMGGLHQWAPLEVTGLSFVGRVNGAPVQIDSAALPLADRKTVSLQLALQGLALAPLMSSVAPGMAANLDMSVDVELALEDFDLSIVQTGTVNLSDIAVISLGSNKEPQSQLDANVRRMSWQGESRQQLNLRPGADLLSQLGLDGQLVIDTLESQWGDREAELDRLSVVTELRFDFPSNHLSGEVDLSATTLQISEQQQSISVEEVKIRLPLLDAPAGIPAELQLLGLNAALSPDSQTILNELSADLTLTRPEGLPVRETDGVQGRLSLKGLSVQTAVRSVNLAFGSSELSARSLKQLAKVELSSVFEGLSAQLSSPQLSGTPSMVEAGGLSLLYDGATQTAEIGVDLQRVDIRINDSQFQGESLGIKAGGVLSSPEPVLQRQSESNREEGKLDSAERAVRVAGTVNLNSAKAKFSSGATATLWQQLEFSGPIDLELTPAFLEQPIKLSGALALDQLSYEQDASVVTLASVKGRVALDQQEELSTTADLDLLGLDLRVVSRKVQLERAELSPALRFSGTLAKADQQLSDAKLNLSLSNGRYNSGVQSVDFAAISSELELQRTDLGHQLSAPIEVRGIQVSDTEVEMDLDRLALAFKSQLNPAYEPQFSEVEDVRIIGLSSVLDHPIKLESGTLEKLQIDSNAQLIFESLRLNRLAYGPVESTIAGFTELHIDQAKFADTILEVGLIKTVDLQLDWDNQLHVAPSKTVDESNGSSSAPARVSAIDSATESATEELSQLPFGVVLQGLKAQGKTRLSYSDASLNSPLSLSIDVSEFTAGAWDSQTDKPIALMLRGSLNQSAEVELDTAITLLKTKPNGVWNVSLGSVQMPILSPLAETYAGYQIRSGALNLDSSGTIDAGQLTGKNSVQIQRLDLQRTQAEAASETDKLFTMPLPSAIALLENDERLIKLDLPLSGDVTDPKFNYQDIIQIVVTKGVKQGATAYLTNALQPFGAIYMLYSAVKEVNESGRFIQLQPLEFDETSPELNQLGRDYAAKLGGMMLERPGLTLEICPVTLASEEGVLWEQLASKQEEGGQALSADEIGEQWNLQISELASGRIEALRVALTRLGVAQERLFSCIARSGVSEGPPRVELAF